MPVTVRGTDILFNDSSTQSTAATSWPGVYTGSTPNNTSLPVGTTIFVQTRGATYVSLNMSIVPFLYNNAFAAFYSIDQSYYGMTLSLAGTWRGRGANDQTYQSTFVAQRVA
jgi:hypothetical protein